MHKKETEVKILLWYVRWGLDFNIFYTVRNEDIDAALVHFSTYDIWAAGLGSYWEYKLFSHNKLDKTIVTSL